MDAASISRTDRETCSRPSGHDSSRPKHQRTVDGCVDPLRERHRHCCAGRAGPGVGSSTRPRPLWAPRHPIASGLCVTLTARIPGRNIRSDLSSESVRHKGAGSQPRTSTPGPAADRRCLRTCDAPRTAHPRRCAGHESEATPPKTENIGTEDPTHVSAAPTPRTIAKPTGS